MGVGGFDDVLDGPNRAPMDLYWVEIKVSRGQGDEPIETSATDIAGTFSDAMIAEEAFGRYHVDSDSYGAHFQTGGFSPQNAAERGVRAFRRAAEVAGLPPWPIVPGLPRASKA